MKKASILLLLAISFSACLKFGEDWPSNEFHITGRVLAYGTNEPVAGARVWVTECTGVKNLTDPCIIRTVATDTTDADGWYEMDAKGLGLEVGASKANYDSRNTSEPVNGGSGERVIDVVINPISWIDLTLTNKSNPYYATLSFEYGIRITIPKDSSFHYFTEVLGNRYQKINYAIVTDKGYQRIDTTIYCPGLDTIYTRLKY